MVKKLLVLLFFAVTAFAQTPNVAIPHTDGFNFNQYRDKVRPSPPGFSGDTVKAGDSTTTAPSNAGTNGNWTLLDSILYADKVGALGSALGFGWFADTSDGAVTVSGTTVLSRDMHYSTLTITGSLQPTGFRIFADSIFIGSAGTIVDTGTAGAAGNPGDSALCGAAGNANGGTAGAAQTTYADGYLTRHATTATSAGGAGGTTGSGSTGVQGTTGTTVTSGWGQAGAAGGTSGKAGIGGTATTSSNGVSGIAAGTFTAAAAGAGSYRNLLNLYLDKLFSGTTILLPRYSGFSGGGSSGAQKDNQSGFDHSDGGGGGGGSAGLPGGHIWIAARSIAGTGSINAKGGKGGDGGRGGGGCNVDGAGGGGGGGGGGGNGGLIVIVYKKLATTVTFNVASGGAGIGGGFGTTHVASSVGGTPAVAGSNGGVGSAGYIFKINIR